MPFIIRWPGQIVPGRVSNEIVHEVDTYTTLARVAGAQVPSDRPIDGVDQREFLLRKSEKSSREGFPVFVADRLEAIKWRNWKVVFYDEQRDWWSPPAKLGTPKAFDLVTDPKEEYPETALRRRGPCLYPNSRRARLTLLRSKPAGSNAPPTGRPDGRRLLRAVD